MFVRPAPGMQIRRPDTLTILPDHGEDVPDTDWCARRLRDGDVVDGPAPTDDLANSSAPSDHVKEVEDDHRN